MKITCPHCSAVGSGPRYVKRHLVEEMCVTHKRNADWSRQLGRETHCEDNLLELEEHDRVALFAALSTVQTYCWIDKENEIVDLRIVTYEYAKNIRDWMLKNSYRDTPFDDTPQFKNVVANIERHEERLATARRALRKKEK